MKQQRTGAQDAAKGLMIIAVIFFHCYMMTFTNYLESIQNFNVMMVLFPFLLSAFFFYSGYNYKENERTYKENITRRAKQLLIPLVMAFAISTITISSMELAFNHTNPIGTLLNIGNSTLFFLMSEPVALMTHFPQHGGVIFELILSTGLLWFLYTLFICSIFFYLLVKFTNKRVTNLITVLIGLLLLAFCLGQFVGPYLPYTCQCYPVVLAIMLTAAYLRQSHFLNRYIKTKKDVVLHGINMLIAEGIVVGTCLICYYRFGSLSAGSLPGGQFDARLRGFDAFISFGFGIFGTYFIHTLCRLIKHIPVVGYSLQWIGNRSAIFYLFHPIYLDFAAIVFFQKKVPLGRVQALVYVVIVVALLVLTCLIMRFIHLKKNPDQDYIEQVRNYEAPEVNI